MILSARLELLALRAILLTFKNDGAPHLKNTLSEFDLSLSAETIPVHRFLNRLFLSASGSPVNYVEFNTIKTEFIDEIDSILSSPVTPSVG
ncbi:MAG: hypothetical protein K0R26_2045 [Bacteroidota bacterium]|jgi:hypothetical protein|nr:hypothetical protein [Bacteroidota bacterium]